MGGSIDICCWRELWRLTSGFTPSDLVTNKLNGIQNQLEQGLCYFKPSSTESYTKFAADHKKFEKVLPFIEKLQQFIGLDSLQTWDIFRHYLSSQYHGNAENSLQNFTFMDIRINQLLIEVWNFYNSERMFMLKQLKLMLEYKDSNHIYEKEFSLVIKNISLDKLKISLIKQFEHLVKETPPTKVQNGEMVSLAMQNTWMERNLREQVEILLLILLVVEEKDLSIVEFKKLFSLFKIHNFGRQLSYSKHLEEVYNAAVLKIVFCEVALFYKIVNDSKSLNIRSIIQNIKEDIEVELIRLQQNEEHGAFLLAWMLLLLQDPQGEELFLARYQHFGSKALQLRVFEFLHKMITHSMFSDNSKCAIIVRKSFYHILQMMCDKFDGDGSVSQHPGVVELCSELLTDPRLAAAFWGSVQNPEAPGVVSLWNTALEFFPYDFKAISIFILGLSKAGHESVRTLLDELETLPVYTELYKPGMVGVSNIMNDEDSVLITENYYLHRDKALCVKAKSLAAIMDRRNVTLIHFRQPVSYWRILQHEIQDLLDETVQGQTNILEKLERVLWGIRALVSVLKFTAGDELPDPLVGPCEAVFEVLVRFAHFKTPLLPLIAACLDVSTALVPKFTQRIYIRLKNIRLLPSVEFTNLSHEEYASGVSFQTSTLGLYLVNIEQPSGEYHILNSYLDMLFAFYDCNYDRDISTGVLLPGLVFILREVFPHMSRWFYKTPQAKYSLTLKCVSYLLKVSQLSPEQTTRPADLLLNKTCVFSLLNIENGSALLKLISLGENNIQTVMESETNWIHGPGIEYIKMIQIAMAVLMQVLRLKSLVRDKNDLGPLEHLIYTQPRQKDALKIVPIVAGYINHVFNQQLPNTACRLLRRFALEFQMSLLVCLDMSPHQIRTMFLERLRDESESASLKTVILEFVAACVEKQPGLTEAFFKVSHPQDEKRLFHCEKKSDRTDGILTYMAEYLAAVKNNTNSLYSPLLSHIMGLFHALWKNNMQILVKDLRENEAFWEYLCSPLFQDILPDIKAYSQIFNMMAIELFTFEGKVDKSLRSALEKLFSRDGKHLKRWLDYIFSFDGKKSTLNSVDEIPGWLSLITSWKDFISMVIKYLPFPISLDNKSLMAGHCLDTLNKEMEKIEDGRTLVILSEMYVVFFSNWKEDCFDERRKYFNQITTLLNNSAASFDVLHSRAKNSILAVSTLSLNMLTCDTKTETDLSDSVIRSVCTITCSQLDKMYSDEQNKSNDEQNVKSSNESGHLNPIVLGLRLLEQCINVFKDSFVGWSHWFKSTKLINKLIFFVSLSVRKKSMLSQTLAALNCLTAFARSSVSDDILHCDIGQHLWLQLLPPKELSQAGAQKQSDNVWQVNEWLQVYKCGIEFVTAMLESHGNFFSSDAILFVGVQEDYLNESILLIRQSLDMDALNLTNSALYFISELVKYGYKWRQEHFQSMVALMRSISVCFHYCTAMILRPKGIHFSIESPSTLLTQEETDNAGPSAKVTTTLNKLLELMNLSVVCLKAFSPDLLTLLADPCPDLSKWQLLMELQFCAPKLSDDPFPQLTFGTVVAAVCFLTRSLNYNYHADETPLNSVKKQTSRRGSSRRRTSGGQDDSIRRRTFRSDSVTSLSSTTSTVIIGPSWLAALDKKLVLITLENILTLLASQALLANKDSSVSSRDRQFIRRELCTELPIFHDFVRKKVLDLAHPKNYLARKKFGAYPLLNNEEESRDLSVAQESNQLDDSMELGSNAPPPRSRLSHDSMRVSVVRKLHLDKARTKNTEPLSTPKRFAGQDHYSPTQPPYDSESPERPSALTSTPGTSRTPKRVTWDDISVSPVEEEELLEPIDPDYSPLSEVQIIEEDYLHFLSNVFLYFCQTEL